jgi:phosphoribosylamine--glycine ligase
MRVLLVGSGGREHALAWKISQSPELAALFAAPGNPGIARLAECLPIAANDLPGLVQAAQELSIDLVVIGPEEPLALGLADELGAAGIPVFGPTAAAAQLESSKAWAKDFMQRNGIPTAAYRVFDKHAPAREYLLRQEYPLVIKASGLAAGKGAVVVSSPGEGEAVLEEMFLQHKFGAAAEQVVIESYLQGEEVSVLALLDGEDYLLLPAAQDHKAVYEGDRGPNTGGMGAYSPVPAYGPDQERQVIEQILRPTLRGLQQAGISYRGVLYLGLMLTRSGPQVIEFNCRFGDPETQVVLPRLVSDLLPLLWACAQGRLASADLQVSRAACASVIMAAPGYPGAYPRGLPLSGIEQAEAQGCLVFQAGTRLAQAGLVSVGGRILAVSALGRDLREALDRAYAGVAQIEIPGAHYRRDIGHRALQARQ